MEKPGDSTLQADELLLRQVHPSFVREGRVTSQAFKPTPKDRDQLSVDLGALVTPTESFTRFTAAGHRSLGIHGVTIGECRDQVLPVYRDPLPDNDAHAYIDFQGLSMSQREKRSKKLRDIAEARGWLYGPVRTA